MASKPDCLFGETCQVTASSEHSVANGDVVAPKSILSDNLELSEEGKQLGDDSSRDSLSKNTQSKVTFSSSTAILEDQLTSKIDQRPIGESHRSSDDNGDNCSSVSVVNDASIVGSPSFDKLATAKPSSKLDSSGVSPILDTDRSVGNDPNVKVKSGKDNGQSQDEISKCSDDDEKVKKSKKSAECVDTQDRLGQSASSDENEDSDLVEQDVKVCDICGDAGREDLLAICSRCSDGAEHTYCMRKMLQKVPEGDWLCEECKMAEEIESQKKEMEGKRASRSYLGTRGSGKRPAEDVKVAPVSKKQVMEAGKGSLKISSPSKVDVLSRNNSYKHTDKGKLRVSCQASSLNHMSKISSEGRCCPSMGSLIKSSNGKSMLSKSSSFNTVSKPKVKPMDEVPHKQKDARRHILPDKEGRAIAIGKSLSFKSASSDRPNSTISKVTSLSSKPFVQDFNRLKSPKEHSSLGRKSLSRLDRSLSSSSRSSASVSASKTEQKLTPRGDIASLASASNNRGFNLVKSDDKLLRSKSTSQIARKGSDTVTTPVGVSSTSGFSVSVEKRLNNSNQDEPSSSSSWNSDRAANNGDGLPRSRESSQIDKCKDNKSGRSKQSGRCRDVGHDAESRPLSSPRACNFDSSTARSSGEELKEGNSLKAAITAAMLKKPGIYRRRQLEKSSELATSNVEMRSAAPSHDDLTLHNIISTDIQETRKVSQGCSSDSHKAVNTNNAKQLTGLPAETISKMTDSDSIIRLNGIPIIRDVQIHTSAVPLVHLKMSAIPEHEHIWQGAFQVRRGGKPSELCDGMQAHLSTSASPKVVEAVTKFPQKILFDEIPRMSTWPSQFNASGAREDNIALYFFAKDIESYERNYKSLLENMIKNDLAFKGEINGVELLIFPSNWLPENSQRWNMLYFLWGVFRVRRVAGMDQTFDSKNLQIPSVNVVHLDKKLTAAVLSYSESVSSSKFKDEGLPPGTAVNVVLARESYVSAQRPILSSSSPGIEKKASDTIASSINQKNRTPEAILRQQNSMSGTCSYPGFLTGSVPCPEFECTKKSMNEINSQEREQDAQFLKSDEPLSTSDSNGLEEMVYRKMHDVKDSLCHPAKVFPLDSGEFGVEMSAAEDKMDIKEDRESIPKDALEKGLNLKESNNQRDKKKYLHTVLRDTILQTSADTNQTVQWKYGNDSMVEGQSPGKKLKSDISAASVCNSSGTGASVCDKVSTSSTDDRFGRGCEVRCTSQDTGTTERYFFPLDSAFGNGLQSGDDSMRRKVREPEIEGFLGGFPNLELALGADTKTPNNGIQPLISGVTDDIHKDKPQDKVLLKEEEEDVSASLSLSLSFPFPDGEQGVKPNTKTEQSLPETHHVNTSLLLFGAPQEK